MNKWQSSIVNSCFCACVYRCGLTYLNHYIYYFWTINLSHLFWKILNYSIFLMLRILGMVDCLFTFRVSVQGIWNQLLRYNLFHQCRLRLEIILITYIVFKIQEHHMVSQTWHSRIMHWHPNTLNMWIIASSL